MRKVCQVKLLMGVNMPFCCLYLTNNELTKKTNSFERLQWPCILNVQNGAKHKWNFLWCEWTLRRNWPKLLTGSPLAPDMTAIKDNNSAFTVRHWRRERSGFQRSFEDWVIKCQPAHYTSTASCSHPSSFPTWRGNFDKLIICRKTQFF